MVTRANKVLSCGSGNGTPLRLEQRTSQAQRLHRPTVALTWLGLALSAGQAVKALPDVGALRAARSRGATCWTGHYAALLGRGSRPGARPPPLLPRQR